MKTLVRTRSESEKCVAVVLAVAITVSGVVCGSPRASAAAQNEQARPRASAKAHAGSLLTGVYRLDPLASDKLYTIVTEADTNLPYARQRRFFDDLIVRLSSPDQLAIERRGATVRIASSRAPRLTLRTDLAPRTETDDEGRQTRTHALMRGDNLVFNSANGDDSFEVTFEPLDAGRRLRVTRRITTAGLNQPIVVRSIYDRVSEIARWDIYAGSPDGAEQARTGEQGEAAAERAAVPPAATTTPPRPPETARSRRTATEGAVSRQPAARVDLAANGEVDLLRRSLDEWIAATNRIDIDRQLDFYLPRVAAFYLARDVGLGSVRAEKERTFRNADLVRISAGEPEIIFADANRTAIMRFRKSYDIAKPRARRRGEVVQELRWRRTSDGWRIFSERDVRVLR